MPEALVLLAGRRDFGRRYWVLADPTQRKRGKVQIVDNPNPTATQ